METIKCDEIIENTLLAGNHHLGEIFRSDVILIKAPMVQPVDDVIKDIIEDIKNRKPFDRTHRRLTVILETNGGFVEPVERIATVFRRHYKIVEFVVPNYAYSAGTILALSGDEIYMDYYSVLGPIDPQIYSDDGYIPGMGYLAKFEELLSVVNDKNRDPSTTRGELEFLLEKFDPGKLFFIEQSIEHSKELLRKWLPKYKFKSWKIRKTSGEAVTEEDRRQRANEVAIALGNTQRWHSHGRGIGIKDLGGEEIKLKIINYGNRKKLHSNISNYHGLFIDFMTKLGVKSAIHSGLGTVRLA